MIIRTHHLKLKVDMTMWRASPKRGSKKHALFIALEGSKKAIDVAVACWEQVKK
jgi:hypothetical protein